MLLVNGMSQAIAWNRQVIMQEASQTGTSSLVSAECDDGTKIELSQHGSGVWDISVDGEPYDDYEEEDGEEAARHFMMLCQDHNE
jgi:hypothetical protein